MNLNELEKRAYAETGSFLTVGKKTFNGKQIRNVLLAVAALVLFGSLFLK